MGFRAPTGWSRLWQRFYGSGVSGCGDKFLVQCFLTGALLIRASVGEVRELAAKGQLLIWQLLDCGRDSSSIRWPFPWCGSGSLLWVLGPGPLSLASAEILSA